VATGAIRDRGRCRTEREGVGGIRGTAREGRGPRANASLKTKKKNHRYRKTAHTGEGGSQDLERLGEISSHRGRGKKMRPLKDPRPTYSQGGSGEDFSLEEGH